MPEQTVLIVGGGIAGLSAANQLAAMKIGSILVEKRSTVGGHAAGYACKSTDACVQCGACLVVESCRTVLADPAVEVLTSSRISAVERGGRFRFVIGKESASQSEELTCEADAAILACGFQAFDPRSKPYGYGLFPNVLTNLELEWMLRDRSIPTRPRIDQAQDGPVTILFTDEVSGRMVRLHSDVTVVDETVVPSEELQRLSRILDLGTDAAGFLQTANVHRWPVFTNRRGILAAGPARAVLMPEEIKADAAAAAGAVLGVTRESESAQNKAVIQSAKCVRCLTCYRLCPHRSIQKAGRITVAPEACEGCGICAAECPRGAITLGESGAPFERQLGQFTARSSTAETCRRTDSIHGPIPRKFARPAGCVPASVR